MKNPVGISIGAVRLRRQHAHSFQKILQDELKQRVRWRGVDKDDPEVLTLHLPAVAAASLDDEHPELTRFLRENKGEYLPGVRKKCPTLALKPPPSPPPSPPSKKAKKDDDGSSGGFRFVELFAGIGGFRLGLERPDVGGKCVLANEIDPHAASIYRENFADSDSCLAEGDVLDLSGDNLPKFDMLVGGFPCQPFSNRGEQKGLDDDRGQLYREMARILKEGQPKCFIFENVPGLVTMDGGSRTGRVKGERPRFTPGAVFERILKTMRSCGYNVDWQVLNSRKFLPQMRERVYIIGTRIDLGPGCEKFNWDSLILKDLKEEETATVRNIMEPKDSPAVIASELTPAQLAKVKSVHSKRGTILSEDGRIDPDCKAPTLISRYHTLSSFSTKFIFEEADGTPCRRPRYLTPRECTRLMGFPEDFIVPTHEDAKATNKYYHAIGNAVCPPLISVLGMELMNCIR
eukprot:CAMPEP_0113528980 /NCGR_PEP_ID=MMETSP0015_2-20120614/2141_1 /TAXON_ID=2838 /ORGANISM="Odontella" /LENGTH=460 /DNA_ID=CAMNT_0000427563 /DNA_START=129 /DNA_END=1511 /DNA_ORIENTATION=+ /assembly_acc=CAM_ASM_000160